MSKNKYSHGEHMAEISKMTTLQDIIIMIQKKVIEQKIVIAKLDKVEKEYKNVK